MDISSEVSLSVLGDGWDVEVQENVEGEAGYWTHRCVPSSVGGATPNSFTTTTDVHVTASPTGSTLPVLFPEEPDLPAGGAELDTTDTCSVSWGPPDWVFSCAPDTLVSDSEGHMMTIENVRIRLSR